MLKRMELHRQMSFDTAYAQGISNTQMDYCINGMGEVLNKNMVPIGALLEPT